MKMVYETPKMRVEQFQTNAYCSNCGAGSILVGVIKVAASILGNGAGRNDMLMFYGDSRVESLNQFSGQNQYYYTWSGNTMNDADDDTTGFKTWQMSDYYLEYSAYESQQQGRDIFVLYKESQYSGYYDVEVEGQYKKDDAGNVIGDGSTTLQTNTGMPYSRPAYSSPAGFREEGLNGPGTDFLYEGERVHANYWFADQCIGQVSPEKSTVEEPWEIVNS